MNTNLKLKETITYVVENSTYYKKVFKKENLDISTINLTEDLTKLPFTTKDDLALHNEDFLCVPKSKIVDYVSTSGTLASPVSFYLTERDIDRLAQNEKSSFELAGCTSNDVFQMMVTMDKQFMAGLAYYSGIRALKAGVIRQGPGGLESQLNSIIRFHTTVLIAVPSFVIKLMTYAKEKEVDLSSLSVQKIICIGEPIRNINFEFNKLGQKISDGWDVELYSTYASTEMGAAFTDCKIGNGGHLNPDLLCLEVVDDNGDWVNDGEVGEVVVTTLGVEGMPLIRYKTGDLCHVYYSKCQCGSESPRLGSVVGRKQQMIKFKGTTIFPPSIFEVLVEKNVDLYQVEVLKNEFNLDELRVNLPLSLKDNESIKGLKALFNSKLRVTPEFVFVEDAILAARVHNKEKRKPENIKFSY